MQFDHFNSSALSRYSVLNLFAQHEENTWKKKTQLKKGTGIGWGKL